MGLMLGRWVVVSWAVAVATSRAFLFVCLLLSFFLCSCLTILYYHLIQGADQPAVDPVLMETGANHNLCCHSDVFMHSNTLVHTVWGSKAKVAPSSAGGHECVTWRIFRGWERFRLWLWGEFRESLTNVQGEIKKTLNQQWPRSTRW